MPSFVGDFLRRARKSSQHSSLAAFAAALGVGKTRLSSIEKGRVPRDIEMLCGALALSGLPPSELAVAILKDCGGSDAIETAGRIQSVASPASKESLQTQIEEIAEGYSLTSLPTTVLCSLVIDHGLSLDGARIIADLLSHYQRGTNTD